MKLFIALMLILLSACACKKIKFTTDYGFLNSAQANSPEYLVKINGSYCQDMDGNIGLCAKRIKSDEKVSFILDKRPYSYRLNVDCTSSINFTLSVDVLKDAPFSFEIPAKNLSDVKTFTCVGEVFPQDRDEEVSAFWHARFVIFDKDYRAREEIYTYQDKLILGQHAKYSLINEDFVIKRKTYIPIEGVKKAYTESDVMRFNYYGYTRE